MIEEIRKIRESAQAELQGIDSPESLEAFRLLYLGKKGRLPDLFKKFGSIPPEQRKEVGAELNRVKEWIESSVAEMRGKLGSSDGVRESFDPTLPGIPPHSGSIHILQQTIEEITTLYARMGFETVEGPEIETEFHNFTALNIPLDHPSRDSFDTFYTDKGQLLRSQTSTVQIRIMQARKPPLRIIAPGRVYRPDTVDASHSFMFHQIEGLMVDEKVTFSDLKGVLHLFLRELFGSEIKIRFRPHFFPFTEPSVEVDIQWGKGWMEILGAGSVDPNVFDAVGYDKSRVRGFAFGLGVERIAMIRHGITDIRHFYENDLRFLRQFA
ncbi:MAG: Phenylalanine--tRNA ligase alpha subunit [Candidatus Omnitrophica bacterium ADurb.Bin292]|jgi:phenylalanyl-tRNA synthetase alpha chain|nr:MAG: Phenylalanine--tRNA ligase alpha subunit [Candidatus Omnitrophica bacterium ADurb.Bin292]HPW76793.1 phenylalanine--tRNA ligase subunit alpha [Candidatus Omnitrophota bacterium]HQB11628.1 phenylalanine--tRNA ligase subunit alpha [Candidatus Omnitrophota bacterium]